MRPWTTVECRRAFQRAVDGIGLESPWDSQNAVSYSPYPAVLALNPVFVSRTTVPGQFASLNVGRIEPTGHVRVEAEALGARLQDYNWVK